MRACTSILVGLRLTKRADLKNAFELEVVRIYMCGVKDREELKAILR